MVKRKFKKRRNYQRKENPKKMMKEMANNHLDVLQNIEFSILETCREHQKIDDRTVAAALKNAIDGSEPADLLTTELVKNLDHYRHLNLSVSDEIWTKGLEVVLNSVHTHSDTKPGDKYYLAFIQSFI